jgi:hypothetical protein
MEFDVINLKAGLGAFWKKGLWGGDLLSARSFTWAGWNGVTEITGFIGRDARILGF